MTEFSIIRCYEYFCVKDFNEKKKYFRIFQVADRVEKTRQIEAIARLYDSLDNPLVLDYENLKIYELREQAWNPNILNIEIGHFSNLNTGEIRYFITGAELGETKLTITSGTGEKTVTSPAYPIQVSTNDIYFFQKCMYLKFIIRTAKTIS